MKAKSSTASASVASSASTTTANALDQPVAVAVATNPQPPTKAVTTGKRTYADANLSAVDPKCTSLPLTLERDAHLRRRLRRRRRLLTDCPLSSQSVSRRLWAREIGEPVCDASALFVKERFSGMRLQATLDTHDLEALTSKIPWLRVRSKIVEIVSFNDLILALTHNGVCAAFDRFHRKRVCFLNITDDEVIRSLFLNKANETLITVSVFRKDDFSSLHCRSTPLADVRRGYLKSGVPIFESESLRWPGFVEFDDVNGKILTFSAEDNKYKIWDLKSYALLYTILDDNIQEIKISPGVVLLIYNRQESHVPIRILNVETGRKIKEVNHLLHRKRKVDFIEQFHEKLLVKQEHENLQIVDVYTGEQVEIERSHQLTPNAFIFLYESELFLTFQQRQVIVWNFGGERVSDFEDHQLYRSDSNTNCIYITKHQDIIVSYCHQGGNCRHGTINLSSILTGKLLGKITCQSGANNNNRNRLNNGGGAAGAAASATAAPTPATPSNPATGGANRVMASTATPEADGHYADGSEHMRALQDITALFYNEERNEIYCGSSDGLVHIWSN